MTFAKLRKSLSDLGTQSIENAEHLLAEIAEHRAGFAEDFEHALAMMAKAPAKQDRADVRAHLLTAQGHALALGHHAYDLFPRRRMRQLLAKLDSFSPGDLIEIANVIKARQDLQAEILGGVLSEQEIPRAAGHLRRIDAHLAAALTSRRERIFAAMNNTLVDAVARAVHLAIQPVGWTAEQIASPLKASRRWYTGGKAARIAGHVLEGFLSRASLARTGFETSWGVRFIVPGTVGFLGNAGPWVMAYTGRLRDYQAMTVPFRVNPGATVATDVATFTWNRPGFGAGTATPLASGYVDSARSKLLIGRDGIAYVRVGEWEGRGPYFTVSAFIPLLPWMHITWNASLFSPGWAPVVTWSSPAVTWVRGQADWFYRTVTAPFRR